MKAVIQTGYQRAEILDINQSNLLPISVKVKTKFVPILRYDLLKLTGAINVDYPKIMGYGGVGIVTQVGSLRSKFLLNKKVLFLNPAGSFQEQIISNIPPLVIPILENISLKDAALLIGGADLAVTLYKLIMKKHKDVVIYGANSITGLVLMQLLTHHSNLAIVPKVRPESKKYLDQKIAQYNIRIQDQLLNHEYIVVDLVGEQINNQLFLHSHDGIEVISVAQPNKPGIKFISQPNFPRDYIFLMKEINKGNLYIPIGKIFSFVNFADAFEYQANSHSRGRNLLAF